ncbi:MAG: ABC transporter substrate-binding protein, partial [Acidimicrobiales bacterium]|nr:ABC transporter substrate-binding protein [Acidimicrobiales bacterium]
MRVPGMLSRLVGALAAVTLLVGPGVGGVAAASSRAATPHASASPITICALASLSGPYQIISQGELTGWNAYVKWVNSRGGILGHPVKMVVENDGSQAQLAVALVRKCVTQDHANFIIGPGGTSDAAAAIPVANAMHTVMLEATSGWHALGLSNGELHSFGFPSIDNVFLLDDLDTVTKLIVPRHYTRVAVIQESDPGGRLNSGYMQAFGK